MFRSDKGCQECYGFSVMSESFSIPLTERRDGVWIESEDLGFSYDEHRRSECQGT